ncbi:MAG: hypothetical protein ACR65U_09130 [Methylocystis sp.]
MMPPRKKSPTASDAAEQAATLRRRDARSAKERASLEDRDLATSDEFSKVVCPFATFAEWASDADDAAYRDL